jgi:hypothetical protein
VVTLSATIEDGETGTLGTFTIREDGDNDEAFARSFVYLLRALSPFLCRDWYVLAGIVASFAEQTGPKEDLAPIDPFIDAAWKVREFWDEFDRKREAEKKSHGQS